MGNHKQKWTADEEEALKAGVKKHGMGKWKTILVDPDFAPSLTHRSNIDLKVQSFSLFLIAQLLSLFFFYLNNSLFLEFFVIHCF